MHLLFETNVFNYNNITSTDVFRVVLYRCIQKRDACTHFKRLLLTASGCTKLVYSILQSVPETEKSKQKNWLLTSFAEKRTFAQMPHFEVMCTLVL